MSLYCAGEVLEKNRNLPEGEKLPLPQAAAFGTVEEDKASLDKIAEAAQRDFGFTQKMMREKIREWRETDDAGRDEIRGRLQEARPMTQWTDADQTDMGRWMTDYLQFAGYLRPASPRMFKMMIMTAFPPLWDTSRPDVDMWEDYISDPTRILTKFDRLMASYNKMDKTNQKAAATYQHFQPAQAGPVGA